jgi:hypothetical protein
MKTKEKGFIIYEGKSILNDKNIVAIVTMKSSNIKTGDMASMWILNADESPIEASKSGNDDSVCGMCPQRHHLGGSCYVTLFQAPLQVYKSYKKGSYKKLESFEVFEGVKMRFGAYGDVGAIPLDIIAQIKSYVKNNTSYTHQWKTNDNLKAFSMASVDNIEEAIEARDKGWRTFRVTKDIDKLLSNEIICPNYTKGVQCIDCKLCNGNQTNAKSIAIPVHGIKQKKFIEKEVVEFAI